MVGHDDDLGYFARYLQLYTMDGGETVSSVRLDQLPSFVAERIEACCGACPRDGRCDFRVRYLPDFEFDEVFTQRVVQSKKEQSQELEWQLSARKCRTLSNRVFSTVEDAKRFLVLLLKDMFDAHPSEYPKKKQKTLWGEYLGLSASPFETATKQGAHPYDWTTGRSHEIYGKVSEARRGRTKWKATCGRTAGLNGRCEEWDKTDKTEQGCRDWLMERTKEHARKLNIGFDCSESGNVLLKCPLCAGQFTTWCYFTVHIVNMHKVLVVAGASPPGDPLMKCNICANGDPASVPSYDTMADVVKHVEADHGA